MSSDFEKALENMALLNEQSAAVNANTAANLEVIGKTVIQQGEQLDELTNKMNQVADDSKKLGSRMDEIEVNNFVNPTQLAVMQEHATQRVSELLKSEKGSAKWDVYAHTFYRRLWTSFKKRFAIPKYAWLRRIDYKIGLDVIDGWKPNGGARALMDEIDRRNLNLEKERQRIERAAKMELEDEE